MVPSENDLANAVHMLLKRVDELEKKVQLLEAEALATKAACATTARFEAAIKRFGNSVPGLANDMNGVLDGLQYVPIFERREQEAWLHQHTCGKVQYWDAEMDAELAAFLASHPGSLQIYPTDNYEARTAVWVAALVNVVDKLGVFHDCVTGNPFIVMAD